MVSLLLTSQLWMEISSDPSWICMGNTRIIHTEYMGYTYYRDREHGVYTHYTHRVHTAHILYTLSTHSIHAVYIKYSHSVHRVHYVHYSLIKTQFTDTRMTVCVCLTGFLNFSQMQLMGGAPENLQRISTFSPARIFMSSGNCSIWGGKAEHVCRCNTHKRNRSITVFKGLLCSAHVSVSPCLGGVLAVGFFILASPEKQWSKWKVWCLGTKTLP